MSAKRQATGRATESSSEELPPGLFWRNDVLWIRKKVKGRRFQFSTGCRTLEDGLKAYREFLNEHGLGRKKTTASAAAVNRSVKIVPVAERFRRSMQVGNVLFCCVDEISTRKLIWEAVNTRIDFFADGRMAAEVLRVLVAAEEESRRHYPTTLFSSEQAYQGSCTAKSTIFCANIAAGLMLSQFSRWLRRMPVESDICLNLLSTELTVLPAGDAQPDAGL